METLKNIKQEKIEELKNEIKKHAKCGENFKNKNGGFFHLNCYTCRELSSQIINIQNNQLLKNEKINLIKMGGNETFSEDKAKLEVLQVMDGIIGNSEQVIIDIFKGYFTGSKGSIDSIYYAILEGEIWDL